MARLNLKIKFATCTTLYSPGLFLAGFSNGNRYFISTKGLHHFCNYFWIPKGGTAGGYFILAFMLRRLQYSPIKYHIYYRFPAGTKWLFAWPHRVWSKNSHCRDCFSSRRKNDGQIGYHQGMPDPGLTFPVLLQELECIFIIQVRVIKRPRFIHLYDTERIGRRRFGGCFRPPR